MASSTVSQIVLFNRKAMHANESLVYVDSDASLTHKTSVAGFRQHSAAFHATSYARRGLALVW